MNIAAWIAAAVAGLFAILRLLNPAPGMFTRGLINAGIAAVIAALPVLHRFNPLAGPLMFIGIAYAILFRTSYQIGTGGGAFMYYLTATALGVLLLGTEQVVLAAVTGAVAASLIIILHIIAPANTGLVSTKAHFWAILSPIPW